MLITTAPINTARLLKRRAPIRQPELRPYAVTHTNRPGFIERQDGTWICLPVARQAKRTPNKPKARRRLWHWLAGVLEEKSSPQGAAQ